MGQKSTQASRIRQRIAVMESLIHGKISRREAAGQLHISIRQISRLQSRYRKDGTDGLIHGLQGSHSNRRYDRALRAEVIRLYKESYDDYGPTLFAETLNKHHQIRVSDEWIRQLLIKKNLWMRERKRRRHRKKRVRREERGALIQFDGSDHLWLERRGPRNTLLLSIDDADSEILASMVPTEDTQHVLEFWKEYVTRLGIPTAVYTDFGSVYHNNQHPEHLTDFGRAMKVLGIEHIKAHSPQAKGRVERTFRTFQDRFVKELRRVQINDIDQANTFLIQVYLPSERLRRPPDKHRTKRKNVHRRCVLTQQELNNIFCFEHPRHLYNDYTIVANKIVYQVASSTTPLPRPGSRILFRRWLDGSIHLFTDNGIDELSFYEFSPQALTSTHSVPKKTSKPAKDHPWRIKALNRKGALRSHSRKSKK